MGIQIELLRAKLMASGTNSGLSSAETIDE
jgi:hypothetical protein